MPPFALRSSSASCSPLWVDWPNVVSQYLRFVQLLKLCRFGQPFSLNDFGCGYGALLEFLAMRHSDAAVSYRGIDISRAMVVAARARWAGAPHEPYDAHARALDHGSVCDGVAERHADLEDVGAAAVERPQDLRRSRQIRIAGRGEGHQPRALLGAQSGECLIDA